MTDSEKTSRHGATPYVGRDRRAGPAGEGRRTTAAVVALLTVPIALAVEAAWRAHPILNRLPLDESGAMLGAAGALSIVASAVMLTAHRHSGRAPDAWMGVAFALLAVWMIFDFVPLRLSASAGLLLVGARSAFGPAIDSRMTVARAAGVVLVVVVGVTTVAAVTSALMGASAARVGGSDDTTAPLSVVAAMVAAGVGIVLGLQDVSMRLAEQARRALADQVLCAAREEAAGNERSLRDERDHDLRSGLFAIEVAIAELAAVVPGDAEARRIAAEMSIETARLAHMLSNVVPSTAPSAIAVRDVLSPVVLLERARGVDIHDELDADARTDVPSDVLVRIARILLDNAREHSPGTRVEVLAHRRHDWIEITVRSGDGAIDPVSVARAWASSTPADRLHGVGLLSAARLIEGHGGHLGARRRGGGGMAFTVELPVEESAAPLLSSAPVVATLSGRRHADQRARRPKNTASRRVEAA
jgi:signal transduction histidine kinase